MFFFILFEFQFSSVVTCEPKNFVHNVLLKSVPHIICSIYKVYTMEAQLPVVTYSFISSFPFAYAKWF